MSTPLTSGVLIFALVRELLLQKDEGRDSKNVHCVFDRSDDRVAVLALCVRRFCVCIVDHLDGRIFSLWFRLVAAFSHADGATATQFPVATSSKGISMTLWVHW